MLNEIIEDVFNQNWTGEDTLSSIENMRKQLYKNLQDQLNGYWSGSSAYSIMNHGSFNGDLIIKNDNLQICATSY